MSAKFDMGPGDCCKEGCGLCCYGCCCPCLAFKEAADNMNPEGSNGLVCCLVTFLGGGCCVLTALGDEVAQKRGIEGGGLACSAIKSIFNVCTCFTCSVVHESRLYKAAGGAAPAPSAVKMERK